ncbi:type II 3-dehydroquinate dehydratase [Subtercola frigoramans]|uniref:3-dehydroquinate dehydratase n=1 Tax=Subtercola frigoramans TaxID=120298 RepID=A0ABS2L1R8_9MICO|nr:type II 3-dehydroquinate dehydratase [Subtercola frigoramans]MBM7471012.1 3-dehydroquinate dehydratase-2 [Subtercola frigoramans]
MTPTSPTAPAPRILLLNGPNLNMLGTREPLIYGTQTLADVERLVTSSAHEFGYEVDALQSNHEGELIDALHRARTTHVGVLLNAGGLTHTSVSLRDAVQASELPMVEIHLSNVHRREDFRHFSYLSEVAIAVIVGAGVTGYRFGVEALHEHLST